VVHRKRSYTSGAPEGLDLRATLERLERIGEFAARTREQPELGAAARGRSALTRAVDGVLELLAAYLPILHWAGVAAGAAILYLYAQIVAVTVRLITAGTPGWSDLPAPAVLALWHGSAPSFLVAFSARRLPGRTVFMIARGARGDYLALLCRLLRFGVVRDDSGHRGWEALSSLVHELGRGARVVIAVDGGGPARAVKPGALALASATGAPLLALGVACRPALVARHKWDRARTPLPFGRVAVACAESSGAGPLVDADSVEIASESLCRDLDRVTADAERAAARPPARQNRAR
jgi:lysophospholipid acyltransferase (LPLAT)-like uncharacterized protein